MKALPPERAAAPATATDRDLRLLAAARGGDGEAFSRLVRPELPSLLRVAARLASPSVAEDAVQEALTLAWERLSTLRPGTPFGAFLMGFTVRRAATLARGDRRRSAREEASANSARRLETSERPDQILEARRLHATIDAGLAALSPRRREALVLRLDGGLDDRAIAAALGSTEGAVRVLLHEALAALDAHLARQEAASKRLGADGAPAASPEGAGRPSPRALSPQSGASR